MLEFLGMIFKAIVAVLMFFINLVIAIVVFIFEFIIYIFHAIFG